MPGSVGTINALFANKGKRAWYLNPGRMLKLKLFNYEKTRKFGQKIN